MPMERPERPFDLALAAVRALDGNQPNLGAEPGYDVRVATLVHFALDQPGVRDLAERLWRDRSPIEPLTEKVAGLLEANNSLGTVYLADVVIDLLKLVKTEVKE